MLTLFSCPKPFRGHINTIQRNAIQSWTKLIPKPEIILLGGEEGMAEVAGEFGICQISSVLRNEFGTPLVNSLFEEAEKAANYDRMCYVNADIILMNDFMRAIQRVVVEKPRSLMVGQRWNLNIKEPLDFGANWEERLITQVARQGKLYPHFAIDYFLFPKGIWGEIPPFTIGRPAWDNWILYRARSQNIPVIDLTKAAIVVHQNHDYSHHPQGWTGAMKGEESKQNIKLAGEIGHVYSLLDAQYRLTREGVKRRVTPYYSPYYMYQLLVRLSESHRYLKPMVNFIKMIGDCFLYRPVKF
jgi:hypothetical protein